MSRLSDDAQLLISLLFSLPILAVWAFALVDIVRRPDLKVVRKVVYSLVVVLVFPVTLLYLLSRPTSIVRHRDRTREDWRDELLDRLDARPGDPPVVGIRQEQLLLERVERLRS
ncbi:MAG: hypothetical protein ACYC2O_08670 [Microthrixaceae bacterium]